MTEQVLPSSVTSTGSVQALHPPSIVYRPPSIVYFLRSFMSTLLQDTIEITQAAGAAIMGYYRASFDVADKSPDNPVTDADFAADNLLKEQLLVRLPQAGWLSEETVDSPDRLDKSLVWVVDPLDGTKEFVMGIPEFSVSVALVEDGQPILGVIYNPAAQELFYAHRDGPVFFNGEPVTVSSRTELEGASIDASRSERKRGEFEPFEQMLTIRTLGSIAYKLARVAAGHCDATWSRGPKNEWDICAGVLLIEAAGGRVVDLDDAGFEFNRPRTLVNGIIGDNGRLHPQILEALAPHRHTARR
jgi:myo-inositol-1(or 4)-monophosphatase